MLTSFKNAGKKPISFFRNRVLCTIQYNQYMKFRELSGLLIGKGMSLKSKGFIYTTCIRPAMLYGSETWPTKIEDIRKMQRSEMRMLR